MSALQTEPPRTVADKLKAAQGAVSNIEKTFGKGSIVKMGERVNVPIAVIPTGIYELDDYVIQAGGFPRGRIVEVYGPEAGGKTTLTLQVIAQAQKTGGLAAFIDAEHSFDPTWASKLGVDVNNLFVSQPDSGEQALEIAEELVRSEAFDIIVIDSVAALVPQAELDGEMGDANVGLQARLMSKALRKLTGIVSKSSTTFVFINQIREKIGVMYGSPETTTGGRGLKFYASLRLDVRRISTIKDGETPVGNKVKIKAAKNKVGAPFRACEVDLLFDGGFDGAGSLVDAAVAIGSIEKSGAWYTLDGARFQGRDKLVAFIKDDKAAYAKLVKTLKEKQTA